MDVYSPESRMQRLRAWFPLAGIALVALALRLYRIEAESVDFEEYVALAPLHAAGNLWDYLAALRANDVIIAPVPFVLGYAWSLVVGTDPAAMRLLFVALSLAHLPLLYALGTMMFGPGRSGRFAGLLAAACFALSPVHIFHAQEYRHTATMTLLALCSTYCMARGLEDGRRKWWALNLGSNLLLSLTHLLSGPLFWAIQGVFLLAYRFRNVRFWLGWFVASAICAIPWMVWAATAPKESPEEFVGYEAPTVTMVAWDLFADDIVYINPNFEPPGETWKCLPEEAGQVLGLYHRVFESVIYFFSMAAAVWMLLRVGPGLGVGLGVGRLYTAALPSRAEKMLWHTLWLPVWFAGPLLAVVVLSYCWRPCFSSRYTLYSMFALYLALGGMLASLPWKWGVRGVVAMLVTAYFLEVSIVQPAPQRTDFRGALAAVEKEGAPDDALIAMGPLWTVMPALLRCNGPGTVRPIVSVEQFETLTGFVETLANARYDAGLPPRPVWALMPRASSTDSNLRLEGLLHEAGFTFVKTFLRGNRELSLYRIVPAADFAPRAFPFLIPPRELEGMAAWFSRNRDVPEVRGLIPEALPDFLDGGMRLMQALVAVDAPKEVTDALLAHALTVNPWMAVEIEQVEIGLDACRHTPPVSPALFGMANALLEYVHAAPLTPCLEPGNVPWGIEGPGEAGYDGVLSFVEERGAKGAECFTQRIAFALNDALATAEALAHESRAFLEAGLYREARQTAIQMRRKFPDTAAGAAALIEAATPKR